MNEITDLSVQILICACMNSFLVCGFKTTLQKVLNNKRAPKIVNLFINYVSAFVFVLFFDYLYWYQYIAIGFLIGCVSVAVYKSALESLMNLIPAVIKKIAG